MKKGTVGVVDSLGLCLCVCTRCVCVFFLITGYSGFVSVPGVFGCCGVCDCGWVGVPG